MNSIVKVLATILALCHIIAAQVAVLPGYSFDGSKLRGVQIQVLATGVGSNVYLIHNDVQGQWRQPPLRIAATYSRPVVDGTNQEIWVIDNVPLADQTAGIREFYIQYVAANGRTYYGNNGGSNYPVSTGSPPPTTPTATIPSPSSPSPSPPPPSSTGVCEPITPAWSPSVDLIDTSNFHSQGKPAEGWYVTTIHATLLKNGQIYLVGWDRRDYIRCAKPDGTRKHGVSFVINASDIMKAGTAPRPQNGRNPTLTIPTPIPDRRIHDADTLYCSGQVTLADGRVFVVGGASYQNLGMQNEVEVGVAYARIYNPETGSYTVTPDAPISTMWYPTAARLTNGDILVTGGFARCCSGDSDANDNVAIYHPSTNSWTRLGFVPNHLITPSLRDYTHIWVLPKPTTVNGALRHVAMMGYKGIMTYYNTDPSTPEWQRITTAPNGNRQLSQGNGGGYDATSFQSPTGELVTVGGGSQPWKLDAYNPLTSSWRSLDTTFSRDNPTSVLLPDGTVLLLNGRNRFDPNQVPPPQIFDPFTNTITTLPAWTDDPNIRAYHSWALLLKDGRVAVGGGIDERGHDIACERVDVRIFTPPYLRNTQTKNCITRPQITTTTSSPITFTMDRSQSTAANPPTTVSFSGAAIRSVRGASLMALGSFTHSFDQHQRYVPLNVQVVAQPNGATPGTLTLSVPMGEALLEGLYNLFLIGEDGVPSVGALAKITVV
ncbi:hypothetical protein DFJ77DRAFT_353894 [Powellomyces hirtus]|nr:hypothetical protein DFJ77DRAFT_353894 [Powellomyces hirtus]